MLQGLDLPRNGDFYICGPSAFMSDLTAGLAALGIAPESHSHRDFRRWSIHYAGRRGFAAPAAAFAGRPPGSGALVSFARSGLSVRWGPTFHSLLELAEACDVPVRWSCRTGVCHTCETALVAGTVSYRPDPVDAPADGNVLICCSRPEGDVVIDL